MPRALSIGLVLLIGGPVVVFGGLGPILMNRHRGWRRWATYAGSVLSVIGAVGFFETLLSAVGGLNWLPSSFEWPIGYANGVVFTESGMAIVPHVDSGRGVRRRHATRADRFRPDTPGRHGH